MKKCSRCKQSKPLGEFRWKNEAKGWKQPYCIECNKDYQREHYGKNKQNYLEVAKRTKAKYLEGIHANMIEYFAKHPCLDCGNTDPRVLEFDHIGDKEYNISRMVSNHYSWERIQKEIAKCEVRCRNCHSIVTYERMGSARALWNMAHSSIG